MRWEFFYQDQGRGLIRLYRRLLALRKQLSLFRRGNYYFHNDWNQWQGRGVLLFSRSEGGTYALVALNFTDTDITTGFSFPQAGTYQELLHGSQLQVGDTQWPTTITIPSNYGRVWMHSG